MQTSNQQCSGDAEDAVYLNAASSRWPPNTRPARVNHYTTSMVSLLAKGLFG